MSLQSTTMYQSIPMAGTFGYEPYQRTLFGLNRGIEAHGMYMNVRTAQVIEDQVGDGGKAKQLMLQVGMLGSSLESSVPEQMFTDPSTGAIPEAFSTAKALGMAIQQGQRIYTITQQNQAAALPALHLDSLAMSEIRNALATGKEVITHTDQLTVPGFRGSGYAIIDPLTGDGTYKISGGKNGAALILGGLALIMLTFTLGTFALGSAIGLAIMPALAAVLAGATLLVMAGVSLIQGDLRWCSNYFSGAIAAFATAIALLPGLKEVLATIGVAYFGVLGGASAILLTIGESDVVGRVCK